MFGFLTLLIWDKLLQRLALSFDTICIDCYSFFASLPFSCAYPPEAANTRCSISTKKGWKCIIDDYLFLREMNSDPSKSDVNMTFKIIINRSNDSQTMQK